MAQSKKNFQITDEQLFQPLKDYFEGNSRTATLIEFSNILNPTIKKLKDEIQTKQYALKKMLEFLNHLQYSAHELNQSKLPWNDCIKIKLKWCSISKKLFCTFQTNPENLSELQDLYDGICDSKKNIGIVQHNWDRKYFKNYSFTAFVFKQEHNPFHEKYRYNEVS